MTAAIVRAPVGRHRMDGARCHVDEPTAVEREAGIEARGFFVALHRELELERHPLLDVGERNAGVDAKAWPFVRAELTEHAAVVEAERIEIAVGGNAEQRRLALTHAH